MYNYLSLFRGNCVFLFCVICVVKFKVLVCMSGDRMAVLSHLTAHRTFDLITFTRDFSRFDKHLIKQT